MATILATGYVHDLIDNKLTFPQFAMRCARAFGALITMRDDAMAAPIPEEFKPSDYHVNALASAKEELAKLHSMTPEEQIAFGQQKKDASIKSAEEYRDKEAADIAICRAMLERVKEWVPPTKDHAGLKEFMIEQISGSLKESEWSKRQVTEYRKKTPARYFSDAVASAEWNIKHHEEEQQKEIQRAAERTWWVKALRDSLGGAK